MHLHLGRGAGIVFVAMPTPTLPKALAFDVFGTVVDWRTSIAREFATVLAEIGDGECDVAGFADAWRRS